MKKSNKVIFIVAIIAIVAGIVGFILMGNNISKDRKMPDANSQTGEILSGITISQTFKNTTNNISEIALVFSRAYDLGEDVDIVIELLDGENILASASYSADSIEANHRTYLKPNSPIAGYVGKDLTLRVYTTSSAGTGLFLMTDTSENTSYSYGGQVVNGTICFSVTGK